jgi:hypothetical protein
MTTHLSDIAGDRNPLAPCTGCESLDAIGKEMFQAPGLLELERTLERHPHYPLLKLKEQMARRPAFVLGLGGESRESVGGFRDLAWPAAPAHSNGRRDSLLGPPDTKSRLWGGDDAGGYQTAAACQKRSGAGAIREPSRVGVEPRATAPKRRRRRRKFGGRGVKKDYTYWLDRWEKDVGQEVKEDGYTRKEFGLQMQERVYSLTSEPAAKEINERYRQYNGGENVVSASSLRRRYPSTTMTNARGETIKVKGGYVCERWGQWEIHRKGYEPEDRLADGSMRMELAGEDVDERNQLPQRGATGPENAEGPPEGDGDKRKRGIFDGELQTATQQDIAKEAIATGGLTKHEGGCGITHVRPPVDDKECQDDLDERAAMKFLRDAGVDPYDVPWRPVVGAEREQSTDQLTN